MIRLILMTITAAALAVTSAKADSLTCTEFKERLANAIDAGGNLVAVPDNYTVHSHADEHGANDQRTTYDWGGIVGFDGTMECIHGDAFKGFWANADMTTPDDREAVWRMNRAIALGAAMITAGTGTPLKKSADIVMKLAAKTAAEFKAAKERGSTFQLGEDFVDLGRSGLQAETDFDGETFFVSLTFPPK